MKYFLDIMSKMYWFRFLIKEIIMISIFLLRIVDLHCRYYFQKETITKFYWTFFSLNYFELSFLFNNIFYHVSSTSHGIFTYINEFRKDKKIDQRKLISFESFDEIVVLYSADGWRQCFDVFCRIDLVGVNAMWSWLRIMLDDSHFNGFSFDMKNSNGFEMKMRRNLSIWNVSFRSEKKENLFEKT